MKILPFGRSGWEVGWDGGENEGGVEGVGERTAVGISIE